MISNTSRFNFATRVRFRDASGALAEPERFDILPRVTKTDYPDNVELYPADGDNWSRLAWRALGNGQFYWVICDFSEVVDPMSELVPTEKAFFVAQLAADVPAGAVSTAGVTNAVRIQRGMRVRFEDLNPAHRVAFEAVVSNANAETGVVNFEPATAPAGGIPAALSRVSIVRRLPVRLVCPTVRRLGLQVLDFANPLNTIEG